VGNFCRVETPTSHTPTERARARTAAPNTGIAVAVVFAEDKDVADGMYVGMAAAAARAAQLEAVADNLANAETPGFKAARPAFQAFSGGGPTDKVLSAAVATGTDLRPGPSVQTGGTMDVVPDGSLFLGVTGPNGQTAYTRNGSISVGSDGTLSVAGHPLVGRGGGPILVPAGSVPTIEKNGDVMVNGARADSVALFQLNGILDRVGPAMLAPGAGGGATMVDGSVRVGELEMGNAPVVSSAVDMITAQRHFETAMQAIQTYRRMDEKATEVGRIR
jgi:flagellar basal-body rod protein FlgF